MPRPNRPRARFKALLATACCAVLGAGLLAGAGTAAADQNTGAPAKTEAKAGSRVVGYFTEWGVYDRNYHVKNIDTSGSANKLTHINYAFGNVQGGKCTMGDNFAATEKTYTADQSVDGVADTWDQPLRGNFNQLRELKKKHPNLKVLWSFGGWTWSGGFTQAAQNPAAFAQSCYDLVENSKWADVFDGIDIDWEYPNACGLTCDTSGRAAYKNLMSAVRAKFGSKNLVTAAIPADASSGGKIDAADYAGAAQYVDWYNPMTYDFFGAWDAKGPTAPHSPLSSYSGIPKADWHSQAIVSPPPRSASTRIVSKPMPELQPAEIEEEAGRGQASGEGRRRPVRPPRPRVRILAGGHQVAGGVGVVGPGVHPAADRVLGQVGGQRRAGEGGRQQYHQSENSPSAARARRRHRKLRPLSADVPRAAARGPGHRLGGVRRAGRLPLPLQGAPVHDRGGRRHRPRRQHPAGDGPAAAVHRAPRGVVAVHDSHRRWSTFRVRDGRLRGRLLTWVRRTASRPPSAAHPDPDALVRPPARCVARRP